MSEEQDFNACECGAKEDVGFSTPMIQQLWNGYSDTVFIVYCVSCQRVSPFVVRSPIFEQSDINKAAVKAWNTRTE